MRSKAVIRENRKIKNATPTEYDGIKFKSKLEVIAYKTLKEYGFNPQYEPKKFVLWEGFTPLTPFYAPDVKNPKILTSQESKVIGISYTPDFYIRYNDIDVWIELKSIDNGVYYIKKKMFRYYLDYLYDSMNQKSFYFEVHSKKQLLQMLEILENECP